MGVMDKAVAAALLMERTVRQVYEDRTSSAVQPLQWAILRFLQSRPTSDARVATIAKYLGTTHAPISRAISTLTNRGLVAKVDGDGSSRTAPLVLTEKGRQMLTYDPILQVAKKIAALPDRERKLFEQVLMALAMEQSYEYT